MKPDTKEVLERFFHPASVAVIGASSDEGAFGTLYLKALLTFGYGGRLYPVNPRGGAQDGRASAGAGRRDARRSGFRG